MVLNKSKRGFALLMTLMVVSVIVSITAAIVELSIKQVELSVTTRDSEIAFAAANAGMECAQYARRIAALQIEDADADNTADSPPFRCFGVNQNLQLTTSVIPKSDITIGDKDIVRYYTSKFSWATGDRCSVVKMLTIGVDFESTADVSISNLNNQLSGYPRGVTKTCSPGSFCTVVQVTGYNKDCSQVTINSSDLVRREILLEF